MADDKENSENLKNLILETARVQVAAMNAGITFWKSWIDLASNYSKVVSDELLKAASNEIDSMEAISKITDSSRTMLREMTKLPDITVKSFNADLEKSSSKKASTKATRSAKAKE